MNHIKLRDPKSFTLADENQFHVCMKETMDKYASKGWDVFCDVAPSEAHIFNGIFNGTKDDKHLTVRVGITQDGRWVSHKIQCLN